MSASKKGAAPPVEPPATSVDRKSAETAQRLLGELPDDPDAPPEEPEREAPPGAERAAFETTIRTAAAMLSSLFASYHDSLALGEEETEALVAAWLPVAEKYGGGGMPVELAAVAATALICGPRVLSIRSAQRAARAHAVASDPPQAAGPGAGDGFPS